MATFEDVKLHIPARGHLFYDVVDAPMFDLDLFNFTAPSTWGTATWVGDLSIENLPEWESEGGEVTFKHTWDRPNRASTRTPKSVSGTFNSVNIARETMELGFEGGTYDVTTDSYGVPAAEVTAKKALYLVTEDGTDVSALEFHNTEISGSFPLYNNEEFLEIPLTVTVLTSPTKSQPWRIHFPRPYAGPPAEPTP